MSIELGEEFYDDGCGLITCPDLEASDILEPIIEKWQEKKLPTRKAIKMIQQSFPDLSYREIIKEVLVERE